MSLYHSCDTGSLYGAAVKQGATSVILGDSIVLLGYGVSVYYLCDTG